MKKRHFYLGISILIALSFWIADSTIHYFAYSEAEFEVIPTDFNELWMRSAIVVLLVLFGIYADFHTNKIIKKNDEKHDVYRSMLRAMHHILNNFVQNTLLFRLEAAESKDFDKAVLKQFEEVIESATSQIENLEGIHDPDRVTIEERMQP